MIMRFLVLRYKFHYNVPHMKQISHRAVSGTEPGRTVPAIRRTVALLDLLAQSSRSLSLSEISRRLVLPKSSVHRILATLEEQEFVHRNRDTDRFSLGVRLMALSKAALEGAELREQAMPPLLRLQQDTGLTVHMAIRQHKQAVLIAKLEPLGQPTVGTWIGRAMDLNSTAAGKALIAYLPDAEVARLFSSRAFVRHNHCTIVGMAHLHRELAAVRECGYALDNEEDELGVRCVGAPVFQGRRVVAAISVAGFLDQVEENRIGSIASRVKQAAVLISAQLSRTRAATRPGYEI